MSQRRKWATGKSVKNDEKTTRVWGRQAIPTKPYGPTQARERCFKCGAQVLVAAASIEGQHKTSRWEKGTEGWLLKTCLWVEEERKRREIWSQYRKLARGSHSHPQGNFSTAIFHSRAKSQKPKTNVQLKVDCSIRRWRKSSLNLENWLNCSASCSCSVVWNSFVSSSSRRCTASPTICST